MRKHVLGEKGQHQQGSLFVYPLTATFESFTSLNGPSRFEVLLSVATILLKIIVIQLNVHAAYSVLPLLLIMDFITW